MPLTKKGKEALNAFIKELGKVKGRRIFYSLEHTHPDWVEKWRN